MADGRLAWALAAVIVRYLTTIQHLAKRELARWRLRATAIPHATTRAEVLRPFHSDMSAEGAALFAVLAPRHRRELVPLLVAYVLLWSYVDVLTEREATADPRLFDLLRAALDPRGPAPVYPPALDDGGYLAELVTTCRDACARLPSWSLVEPDVMRLAGYGASVQAINHGARAHVERRLRSWTEGVDASVASWYELSAAASSPLAIHALMALAADPGARRSDVRATTEAYFPWMAALSVLCDHYIDHEQDRALADHSYLDYYASHDAAGEGIRRIAATAAAAVQPIRHGSRHAVILAAMTAMFFSEQNAWTASNAPTSRAVLASVGIPARLLLLVLAVRRRLARTSERHAPPSAD